MDWSTVDFTPATDAIGDALPDIVPAVLGLLGIGLVIKLILRTFKKAV